MTPSLPDSLSKEQKKLLAEFVDALDAHQVASCRFESFAVVAETRQRVIAAFLAALNRKP